MKKIELKIWQLSHSITQAHSYAVILEELEGKRRLPIVIGGFEAQSIAVALEKMEPSRPLTHDLIKNLCSTVGLEIKEIIINNLVDGVFYAQLVCQHGNEKLEIDSRTSDALALAVRFDCPIYTYEFILESAGLILEEMVKEEEEGKVIEKKTKKTAKKGENLSKYGNKELEELLQSALDKEDYEMAIIIRDEISRREKSS